MKTSKMTKRVEVDSSLNRARLARALKEKGIRNSDVLAAVEKVPRHRFLDEALANRAYEDIPLPIGHRQTISQPFIVALMSEKLIASSVDRNSALEIGTGCGYQTAILAELYERVCSIERIKPLFQRAKSTLAALGVDNIELRYGDGCDGWAGRSDFNSILLTAATKSIPLAILDHLASGGCLVAPIENANNQRLTILSNRHGHLYRVDAEAVRFVPLLRGID
jgi:protein-L-isoaspartate(D-aspartate) O-methyltransferase